MRNGVIGAAVVLLAIGGIAEISVGAVVNEGPTTECTVKKVGIERVDKTEFDQTVTVNTLTELRLACGKDDVWFHARRHMRWAGLTTTELQDFDMGRTVFCRPLYAHSYLLGIRHNIGAGRTCGFVE